MTRTPTIRKEAPAANWKQRILAIRAEWLKANYAAARDFSVPEAKPYTDTTTNGLTRCVQDWIKYHDGYSNRISSTGTVMTETVDLAFGNKREIKRFRPGTTNKGTADIHGVVPLIPTDYFINKIGNDPNHNGDLSEAYKWNAFAGKHLSIEVKCRITKDRMRPDQYKEAERVRRAGGLYIIAQDMEQFTQVWDTIIDGTYKVPEAVDVNALPTLDEWRGSDEGKQAKADKDKSTTKDKHAQSSILWAKLTLTPLYVTHDNSQLNLLDRAYHYFKDSGYAVAFRQCITYCKQPEVKVLKKLPKGYEKSAYYENELRLMHQNECNFITSTGPTKRMSYDAILYNGLSQNEIALLPDSTYQRRIASRETICIPTFILGRPHLDATMRPLPNNHSYPTHPGIVYVCDYNPDTDDFKTAWYVKLVQWVLKEKGDTREVKGARMNEANTRFKKFEI